MHPQKSFDYRDLNAPVTRTSKERRRKQRFSFVTNLRYRKQRGDRWEGSGSTVNMSAAGVLVTADRPFPLGAQLQLLLEWSGLYHNAERMLLLVTATVVRSAGKRTAFQIVDHEFLHVPAVQHSRKILSAKKTSHSSPPPTLTLRP